MPQSVPVEGFESIASACFQDAFSEAEASQDQLNSGGASYTVYLRLANGETAPFWGPDVLTIVVSVHIRKRHAATFWPNFNRQATSQHENKHELTFQGQATIQLMQDFIKGTTLGFCELGWYI